MFLKLKRLFDTLILFLESNATYRWHIKTLPWTNCLYGWIFIDINDIVIGWFAQNLNIFNAFSCRAHWGYACNWDSFKSKKIESLWLETYFHLVTFAFKSHCLVLWRLSYVELTTNMCFIISHIFIYRRQSMCKQYCFHWASNNYVKTCGMFDKDETIQIQFSLIAWNETNILFYFSYSFLC